MTGGPGRPVQFDRGETIDRAVDLFWSRGFDGTSLDDLVGELGISRSTLYNSFGGKDGLYASALDRYLERTEREIVVPLQNGEGGLEDLVAFVDRVEAVLMSPQMPAGCLVLNWLDASRNSAAGERYVSALHGAIDAGLRRAADRGEIDSSSIDDRTAMLLAAVLGVNQAAHAPSEVLDVSRLVSGVRSTIAGWAT